MKTLKWVIIILCSIALLIGLACLEEDWRGQMAWEKCRRDAEAKGLILDWNAFIPPPVLDDQNFFKAPKMQAWFQENPDPYDKSHTALWGLSTNKYSLESITNKILAEKFLAWSDQFNPQLDFIRAALTRPCARMVGDYSYPPNMPTPNFVAFKSVAENLSMRAKADILLDKPQGALDELTLLNQLRHVLDLPPSGQPVTLVTGMIDVAIGGLYATTMADGLQSHAWQDQQLASLQEQLQQINLAQRLKDAIRVEVPYDCYLVQNGIISNLSARRVSALRGWLLQNLVTIVNYDQQVLEDSDVSSNAVFPDKLNQWETHQNEFKHHNVSPENFFALMAIPNFTKAWCTTAYYQAMVNEAQIACALERYRLVHGEYPEALNSLVPKFLGAIPPDIINGQPLHYHRTSGGKFLLYSVGWNEKDDGGLESPHTEDYGITYTNGDWDYPDTAH